MLVFAYLLSDGEQVSHFLAGLISGGWFVLVYGDGMNGAGKGKGDNVMEPIDHAHKPGAIGHPSVRYHVAGTTPPPEDEEEEEEEEEAEPEKASAVDELLAESQDKPEVVEMAEDK